MALVTRLPSADIDAGAAMLNPVLSGDLIAGEALDAVAPCYLAADGKYYMCDATTAGVKTRVAGWTPQAYKQNAVIDLVQGDGTTASYATGLTPGIPLYLASTKGRLDTAPGTGDAGPVAQVMHDGGRIRFTRLI